MWNFKWDTLQKKYFTWWNKNEGLGSDIYLFKEIFLSDIGNFAICMFSVFVIFCVLIRFYMVYFPPMSLSTLLECLLLLCGVVLFFSVCVLAYLIGTYLNRRKLWNARDELLSKIEELARKELKERKKFNQLRLNAKKEGAFDKGTHTGKFLARINKPFGRDIFQKLETSELERELQEIQELRDELHRNSVEVQVDN